MRYYLIAGEASGDLHGSNLVKGLRAEDPEAVLRCRGGELMQAAGAELAAHYREGAVMGFTDVLAKAGKLLRSLRDCKRDITVAVMGCAVNGPGEAREADYGLAGGRGEALLFRRGEILRKVPEAEMVPALLALIEADAEGAI